MFNVYLQPHLRRPHRGWSPGLQMIVVNFCSEMSKLFLHCMASVVQQSRLEITLAGLLVPWAGAPTLLPSGEPGTGRNSQDRTQQPGQEVMLGDCYLVKVTYLWVTSNLPLGCLTWSVHNTYLTSNRLQIYTVEMSHWTNCTVQCFCILNVPLPNEKFIDSSLWIRQLPSYLLLRECKIQKYMFLMQCQYQKRSMSVFIECCDRYK